MRVSRLFMTASAIISLCPYSYVNGDKQGTNRLKGTAERYEFNQYDGVFPLRVRSRRQVRNTEDRLSDGFNLTPLDYMQRRRPLTSHGNQSTKQDSYKLYNCLKKLPPPTTVKFSLHVSEISKVSNGQVTISMYMRYSWEDFRLQNVIDHTEKDYSEIAAAIKSAIWLPDIFIPNAVEVLNPVVFVPSTTFRIYTNHTIYANQYLVVAVACPFDYDYFPMDIQMCDIPFQSFGYTPCEINLEWATHRPLTFSKSALSQFNFMIHRVGPHNKMHVFNPASKGSLERSQLHVHLVLKRQSMFYLMQIYIPSLLFVVVSWISFLIPKEMAQGRMLLTITTMLTMVSLFAAGSDYVPKVSYVKAIDIWMCMCTFLSFSAVVDVLIDVRFDAMKKDKHDAKGLGTYILSAQARRQTIIHIFKKYARRRNQDNGADDEEEDNPFKGAKTPLYKLLHMLFVLHNSSLYMYPVVFALFNLVYWSVLMGAELETGGSHEGEMIQR